ncbi:MAG: hypothetical protein JWM10_1049 [Myxococcaceae bacterium]|nr:hypothetical protein [Myxococcaceae bacterium]
MSPPPIRSAWAPAALAFALASAVGATAAAQPAPPAVPTPALTPTVDRNADTARAYFEAGVAAMSRDDWAEAVNALENSLRLRRAASVSLNLGIARHRLGRLLEARAALNDFRENATPEQHAQHDAEVGRLVAEIGRRVGRVHLTELRPTVSTVTLDGQPAVLNDAREIVVNPGEHRLRAEADGFVTREQTVTVAEGATESVGLVLVPVAAIVVATPARPTPAPVATSDSIFSRWWFWTAVGAVAAGATVGVLVATRRTTTTVAPLPTPATATVLQGVQGGGFSW